MASIEFVDEPAADDAPNSDLDGTPGPGPRHSSGEHDHGTALTISVVTLYVAATALAVVAALSTLYTVGFGPGGRLFRYSIDSWGSYHGAGELTREHQHGPRYAIVLVACAVVFLALALHHAAPWLRLPRLHRAAVLVAPIGVAAAGVLAGTGIAMYLDASAVLASTRSRTEIGVQAGDPIRADLSTGYGPGLWWLVGAGVCAVTAAALVITRPSRRARLLAG